ncbi:serine/threonine protein kinase [Frisingicoccus sp.]|uniref:serine/threonine protein kinase n=1 Tax=Frisingicoccus sp. TaxID=1918627 RepID=UPI003AB70291
MLYAAGTKVFGDWEIKKEIGEGSYGKVFEICKTDYGITTQSALKVIRIPRSPADIRSALSDGMNEASVTSYFQGFVEEIVQEIAVMSSLESHPNVVGYKDHCVLSHNGEIGWDILIRMELLTPLIEYIVSHPLNETDVIQMAEGLCSALVLCQKKGLIHRDIKPENIFVSETGQFKLGDFGVARTIEKTTGGLSKKGTESYMAPEIYLNKPYGSSVDIYSLGLVLYKFMNNNRLPFFPSYPQPITFADRENALGRRMKGDTPSAPANACKEFSDIILKACAYKPEERYRTAADMLEDIRRLRIHLSTAAEAEALSNKRADLIPPTEADILPGQTEGAAQTQGIFDVVSPEETIGLWDIKSQTNDIDNIQEDTDADTVGQEPSPVEEPSHAVEEPATSIEESFRAIEESSPSMGESKPAPEASKARKKSTKDIKNNKNNKPKSKLGIAAVVLLISLCSFFIVVNMIHIRKEKNRTPYIYTLLSDIDALLLDKSFTATLTFCVENQDLLKAGELPYIRQIAHFISGNEFDNALDYCKGNEKELKMYYKGWFQEGKLYSKKAFDTTIPVIYFENNKEKNSFYIYQGSYDTEGKRSGNGKELCVYYSSGNYYYSEGEWVDNILTSGNATKCEISKSGYANSTIGKVIDNNFSKLIRFKSEAPSGHVYTSSYIPQKQSSYFFDD